MVGLLVFAGYGCRQAPQVYLVKGTVQEVKPAEKTVKIAHEKIPNYMDAMTMDFEVKDAKELSGLQSNDYVSFRMVVTEKDGWLESSTRLPNKQATPKPVTNAAVNFRRVREFEPLKVGDLMPEYRFTNEMNQA